MIKVALRKKPISGGRDSLYLDFWPPITLTAGKSTRREFLGMYLISKPRTANDKLNNRQTMDIAETVRAKRQIDVQSGVYQEARSGGDLLLTDYLTTQQKKKSKDKTKSAWGLVIRHVVSAGLESVTLGTLDIKSCVRYKDYLLGLMKEGTISSTTAHLYLVIFRTGIRAAYREDLIPVSLTEKFEGIQADKQPRQYLLLEELNTLLATPIVNETVKKAFVWSSLTGMRISDIRALKWESVIENKDGSAVLDYIITKTGKRHILPIGNQARGLLGDRESLLFEKLPSTPTICRTLSRWTKRAGIDKRISMHSGRHTFATLQLSSGTDIMTVSALLAHADIKTTQIYAKVLDESKARAANRVVVKL